ncbi:hypothetical protein AB4084_37445, partial [Lysobacter sp. 2RAB21]
VDAAFESLVQNGVIDIQVEAFTDADDKRDQEKWALDFFKEDLLSKWFEPTLVPGKLATDAANAGGGSSGGNTGGTGGTGGGTGGTGGGTGGT